MPASTIARRPSPEGISRQILDFLSDIPASHERPHEHPRARTAAIAVAARRKAFFASSSLALPPAPLGWLTVLPELLAIWKIQAQMVADIAAACGRHTTLTRDQMLHCLFRHASSQVARDLVVRTGQRWVVEATTTHAIRSRIGSKLSEQAVGGFLGRMVPFAGAVGVGVYAWYDTRRVARTATAMFMHDREFIPAARGTRGAGRQPGRDRAQAAREAGL